MKGINILLDEKNTLFESLVNKLVDNPDLKEMLYQLLFIGKNIVYNPLNQAVSVAEMFGFVKNDKGSAVPANRIFEMVLYNLFLSEEMQHFNKNKQIGVKEIEIGDKILVEAVV